ncbi:MAG TPA: hypothetical protein VN844_11640 [Pyrinomonadaceae bacterium]|nr:hypothetical protein [Pyrinomonadaceae bacterium]
MDRPTERPPEFLKSFADRMAKLAVAGTAGELIHLLNISGFVGGDKPATKSREEEELEYLSNLAVSSIWRDGDVGIWERRNENGKAAFVRRLDTMDEWHYWANLTRLEPKSTKKRVLLMGESVARGYIYDPAFTPAMVLQMILDQQFGEGETEVVDLARTNLAYEIRALALSALQLEPDIVIFFAGNNWGVPNPNFSDIVRIDKALATEGMAGVKRISDEYIERTSTLVVRDITAAFTEKGIPVVWMIPEFNLGDWREPHINAPYLSGDKNREWITVYQKAENALSNGDAETAEKLARQLIEIDGGLVAAGYYILADCARLAHDVESERAYLESARDSNSWDSSMLYIPRPYSITQEVMRRESANFGYQVVDCPALFKQYLNGEIADRRLFVDYCHLTTEGMQVAMGAAASCVLKSLKGIDVPWYALVNDQMAPSLETEAEANFLAAVHSAHRWQPYDVIRHFCKRAVEFSPHIVEVFLSYIDLQTRNTVPIHMSESEEKILRAGSPLLHHYLFRNNDKRLDKTLLGAIADVLDEIGVPAKEHLDRVRREEHSVKDQEIDLLNYFYLSSAHQPQELEGTRWSSIRLDSDVRFYRAFWPYSKFIFVGEAGLPVKLNLVCRLPKPGPREEKVSLDLNGQLQVEMTLTTEWSAWDISLPGEAVLDGLNEIIVHWPIPEFRTEEALNRVTTRLCHKKFPDFYATFGEIHTLTAGNGLEVATELPIVQTESSLVEVA